MSTISTITGNVNLQGLSSKAHAFLVIPADPNSERARHMGISRQTETFLGKAVRDAATRGTVRLIGNPVILPAIADLDAAKGGKVTRASYQIEEGHILKVMFQRRGQWGTMPGTAHMFLRMRDEAALNRITFELSDNPQAVESHAQVEGRFDILTIAEAEAEGVEVKTAFRKLFDPVKRESIGVDVQEVEPATRRRRSAEVVAEIKVTENNRTVTRKVTRKRRQRSIDLSGE